MRTILAQTSAVLFANWLAIIVYEAYGWAVLWIMPSMILVMATIGVIIMWLFSEDAAINIDTHRQYENKI